MKVFNISIEFNSTKFKKEIENYIEKQLKAYVCVVDANVITLAQKDLEYQRIINNASVNTCDGSSIASMVNLIYGTNHHAFNGPEIFEYYIERPYKHLLLGNTAEKVGQIKNKLRDKGIVNEVHHLNVPFAHVDDFDYRDISEQINSLKPDIIWVSLGAPKQEIFMSKIFPFIKIGVMIGIGAAFNFYTGDIRNNKREWGALRFIWLERLFKEPKKQLSRVFNYLRILP